MTVNGSRFPDCHNCGGEGTREEGGPCPACNGTGIEQSAKIPRRKHKVDPDDGPESLKKLFRI